MAGVRSTTEPAEGTYVCRRLLRGMASLWDHPASGGKAAISATQAVAAAVLRLWTAAQQRHKSVELKVLERLQRHSLMRVWFCRMQRRTFAAGPWMASELRAMRLGVTAIWFGQGRRSAV